jgi:TetR/AcrR family transcriptional regulator
VTLHQLLARLLARLVAAGRIRPVPYPTLHDLVTVGGGALFANPVEAALLGAPAHPDAEDIRAHAEAVADVLIAGIAVTPPGPEPDGVLDGRASSP